MTTRTRHRSPSGPVLIVDDEPHVRSSLSRVMRQRWGVAFEVLEADCPASALALASRRTPGAMVLDVHFPGDTIHASIEGLRGLAPFAAMVAYSGAASHREAHALGRLGVDDYFPKGQAASIDLLIDFIEHWDPIHRSVVLRAADGVEALAAAHEELVRAALRSTGGNQKAAARLLHMSDRLLYYYVRKYRIER